MKKIITVLSICALLFTLVACGSSGYEDGTYTAQTTQDAHGWADVLSVTYSDGVLTDASFNSINEEGTEKSTLAPEEYPMDPTPGEWIPQLTENVKASEGVPEDIATIAGASLSSQNAKNMLEAINENAMEGNTDTAQVENEQ